MPNTHGGPNRGQGRKSKPPEKKFKRRLITIPPEINEKLKNVDASKLITNLLRKEFEMEHIYNGDDRVKQVEWLKQEAGTITHYGEGEAEELVSYWESQVTEKPEWFDAHDRALLVELVKKAIA